MEPTRRRTWPLWLVAAAAGALLAVDLAGYAQVALQGAEAAYPDPGERARVDIDGAPDPSAWLLAVVVPLLLVTGLLVVAGRRLRGTSARTLVGIGVLTAACLALLLSTSGITPLDMTVFCRGCDGGMLEQVPGPVWYLPVRVVALALFAAALLVTLVFAARTAVTAAVDGPAPTTRPGWVRAAVAAATAGALVAVLVVWVDYAALTSGLDAARTDPYAASDQTYFDSALGSQAYETLGWLAARLAFLVLGLVVLARALWRGRVRRPAAVLLLGGFAGVYGVVGFVAALAANPLNWANPLAPHQPALDVPWYPPMLVALTFGGLVTQAVIIVGLLAPTTAGWLSDPRAAERAPSPGPGER